MSYASEFTPVFVKLLRKLDKQIRKRVLRGGEVNRTEFNVPCWIATFSRR
jgi:mRNA-degrading endonuclease RelE of RelBE toxin-antitoxin system